MEVIIPCAGASSRFPNMRPKYLLTDYAGRLMVENAAEPYLGKYRITIVILKEHDEKYMARKKLFDAFNNKIDIVVLDKPTSGPADTVYQAIKRGRINLASSLLVKDCDGFYQTSEQKGNVIYIAKLSKHPRIRTAGAKSYTITNDQGIINSVVEKQIVSDNFCVGGYQFETAQSYIDAFNKLSITSEIFVSNIIDYMISQNKIFFENEVENFIDVGTAEDWFDFNNKPTYFCDIDGTIIKSKWDYYEEIEPLWDNVSALLSKKKSGCKIIFTTSRLEKYRKLTRDILDKLGFDNCDLIMGIHHTKRILINDYANSNPYPTAVAVNLKRDSENLGDMI